MTAGTARPRTRRAPPLSCLAAWPWWSRYAPTSAQRRCPRLKALLDIAAAVRDSGHAVTAELVAAARDAGATDQEIHDVVLIAAAFCMLNRYVDGLATMAPNDPAVYAAGAQRLISAGYLMPPAQPDPRG